MPSFAGRLSSSKKGELVLLVLRDQASRVHPLPESGSVTLGRGEGSDIAIDDISISRRHAVLDMGPPITVADLGSANGTWVQEAKLIGLHGTQSEKTAQSVGDEKRVQRGERAVVEPGKIIRLGAVSIVVQRAMSHDRAPGAEAHPQIRASSAMLESAAIVCDPAMIALYATAKRVAATNISVLIVGETGVGKEVLAETIWRQSPRAAKPFLRLNCAALSESLLESELFGHERGAFTGAVQAKPGLLETAAGGVVFLDEIGELPPVIQAKLLRVLEDRQVLRLGAVAPRFIDVRFITATNRPLERDVESGSFRADLLYRINGIRLAIPPLRERIEEIEPLAKMFLGHFCAELGRQIVPEIGAEARRVMRAHDWPGNVRELRNVIERALVMCEGGLMRPEHLPFEDVGAERSDRPTLPAPPRRGQGPGASATDGESPTREGDEAARILAALAECAGNQTRAAKLLGISRGTLVARLNHYGLPRPRR